MDLVLARRHVVRRVTSCGNSWSGAQLKLCTRVTAITLQSLVTTHYAFPYTFSAVRALYVPEYTF